MFWSKCKIAYLHICHTLRPFNPECLTWGTVYPPSLSVRYFLNYYTFFLRWEFPKIWKGFYIPLAHTVFWFRVVSNNINKQYGLFQAPFCLVKVFLLMQELKKRKWKEQIQSFVLMSVRKPVCFIAKILKTYIHLQLLSYSRWVCPQNNFELLLP